METALTTASTTAPPTTLPQVDGVPLVDPGETVDTDGLRQRACTELLRQAAQRAGLLAADDPLPQGGATSEAATAAIEALLDREVAVPEPSDDACRRHHAAHAARFAIGERVHVRHVLFAVTDGVDLNALRRRAEACLIDLRASDAARLAEVAATTSNCPSGAAGGDLGWLTAADCAPEFGREVFGHAEVGVLPRLVHTRYGLHVVEVVAREPGKQPTFDAVRAAVAASLQRQAFTTALRHYLQRLAAQANVVGVDLDASADPLVQ